MRLAQVLPVAIRRIEELIGDAVVHGAAFTFAREHEGTLASRSRLDMAALVRENDRLGLVA
jgi:hypothetical protein